MFCQQEIESPIIHQASVFKCSGICYEWASWSNYNDEHVWEQPRRCHITSFSLHSYPASAATSRGEVDKAGGQENI